MKSFMSKFWVVDFVCVNIYFELETYGPPYVTIQAASHDIQLATVNCVRDCVTEFKVATEYTYTAKVHNQVLVASMSTGAQITEAYVKLRNKRKETKQLQIKTNPMLASQFLFNYFI